MIKKCPKCGTERQQEEGMTPSYECPSCGIIYAKYEKILKQQKTIKDTPAIKASDINSPQPTIQKPKKKLVNPIIVVSVIIALVISFIGYKFYSNIEKRNAEIAKEEQKLQADREFSALVLAISGKMIELAIDSETVVDEINRAWREAIFSKDGKRDFNDAIMEVKRIRAYDISSIKSLKNEIAEEIKKMTPPVGKEKDYQRLKELYLLFNKYADMAVTPSGSLQAYSQQNSELTVEIKSAVKELEMMR
jgi:predicted GIY-YIG superfamily endonuclease/DNA-directed RNA polymerase subunit RPC12/RpoP